MIGGRLFLGLAAALWLAALARDGWSDWVASTALPPLVPETSVEVTDRNGALLRAYTVADGRWRLAVDSRSVDGDYVNMLISYEDKRFRSHSGVDLQALARASFQAVKSGRFVSGGSTLTMQTARLLEDSGTGQWRGKLRQMRVAWALERRLTKDQILGLYLHLAPFGGNLEGIRAASFAYFGKEPLRLTPAEAALLVAIPQAPESRRPDRFHDNAIAARTRVLQRAARDGTLSPDAAQSALTEIVPHVRRPFPALAPHLADRVRAADPQILKHQVTLDARLQASLEALAAEVIQGHGDRIQVAIVVADHLSAEVLANVGSVAFRADQRLGFVDMTRALRSPGSTLKPLIYGLAFDQGLGHPETLINDRPMTFGTYAPQNFNRMFRGTLRMREALQLSLNLPVVQILDALGPAKLLTALDKAGVTAAIQGDQPGLAIGLGGVGINLTDMVQLYATIARGGVALPLTHLTSGDRTEGQRVLSAVAAWQVADILAGLPPPPGAPTNRLAYKTGTSYGHRDAWALGFDGRHVIGVWMGRPDGTPVPGAFGADTAAPVLFQAFHRLKRQLDPLPPPPSAALLVSNAELPKPLQQFLSRTDAGSLSGNELSVVFPPDGAEVEMLGSGVLVKVQGGQGSFTWLADGVPVAMAKRERNIVLHLPGQGFVVLSVVDAQGRSARVRLRVR